MDVHDVAIIMYTSGTTGLPKGAMLTHGNIMWNNINAMMAFGGSRDDVILTAAPLFHIGGLNVMTISSFHNGSTLVAAARLRCRSGAEEYPAATG